MTLFVNIVTSSRPTRPVLSDEQFRTLPTKKQQNIRHSSCTADETPEKTSRFTQLPSCKIYENIEKYSRHTKIKQFYSRKANCREGNFYNKKTRKQKSFIGLEEFPLKTSKFSFTLERKKIGIIKATKLLTQEMNTIDKPIDIFRAWSQICHYPLKKK